jgi:hypothetical protein
MVTKGYGITIDDIHEGCPNDFKPYDLAHTEEIQEKDSLNYYAGMYNMSALSTVLAAVFGKHEKYVEKPIVSTLLDKKNSTAEGREVVASIEMNEWMKKCRMQGLPSSPK